jgi:hypothetical protein
VSAAGSQTLAGADHTTTNGVTQEAEVGGDQGSESMKFGTSLLFQLLQVDPAGRLLTLLRSYFSTDSTPPS